MTLTAVGGTRTTLTGPRPVTPELLAVHPVAAAQPTPEGRRLNHLTVVGSKLYASYGDYSANTGPIAVAALDLADPDGFVTEITAQTEATGLFTVDGDTLYVPYTDPQGFADPDIGSYAVRTAGSWTVVTVLPAEPVHGFRVLAADGDLFLGGAGSTDDGIALVWRKAAGEWTPDLLAPEGASGFARVYEMAVLDGTLLAWLNDGSTTAYARPSGGPWAEVDTGSSSAVARAQPFDRDGTTVAVARADDGLVSVHSLPADEAVRAATATDLTGASACDLAISLDGEHLYLLNGRRIWRLGSTGAVVQQRTLMVPAISLAVDDTTAYLGTADATVYSIPLADLEP